MWKGSCPGVCPASNYANHWGKLPVGGTPVCTTDLSVWPCWMISRGVSRVGHPLKGTRKQPTRGVPVFADGLQLLPLPCNFIQLYHFLNFLNLTKRLLWTTSLVNTELICKNMAQRKNMQKYGTKKKYAKIWHIDFHVYNGSSHRSQDWKQGYDEVR